MATHDDTVEPLMDAIDDMLVSNKAMPKINIRMN
jgi:hypothetical protein